MEVKILFAENQKFKQWWLWLILLGLNGVFIFGMVNQLYYNKPFGDKPTNDSGLITGFVIVLLLTILFYFFKLQTLIKTDGIYVRFFPIYIAYKKYSWYTLIKSYVRKYSPIGEYGGWGIRFGFYKSGNALNISGNYGLQLEILNKTKLLIGTNKPEELKEVLIKLDKYQE